MIILDTNVISEVLRVHPNGSVLDWLDSQDPYDLYLTAITIRELEFGVHCMPHGKKRTRLETMIEDLCEREFVGRILPFDQKAAQTYGRRLAQARQAGKAVGEADGMIAAIAATNHPCLVATRDHTPFLAMNVDIIDPWTPLHQISHAFPNSQPEP